MAKKKLLSQIELATLGGKATYAKHGSAHYKAMVEKRWKNERKRKREAAKAAKGK